MAKKQKRPRRVNTYANQDKQILRMVSIVADSANDEDRSIAVIIATENPVRRYDAKRKTHVDEILMMDGVQFRTSLRQLPIVDSHDRTTVRNVYGSVRDIEVQGDQLIGRATFADDVESQNAYRKLRDGHLTDFSITASPNEILELQRGESYAIGEREFVGPTDIVMAWQPTDASLVAAGADPTSRVRELRRSYEYHGEDETMDPELLAELIARGMPEAIKEDNAAILRWVIDNPVKRAEDEKEEDDTEREEDDAEEGDDTEREEGDEEEDREDDDKTERAVDKAVKSERRRIQEIQSACEGVGIERAFADDLCRRGLSLNTARKRILGEMAKQSEELGRRPDDDITRTRVTESETDKFNAAVRDGLIMRSVASSGVSRPAFEGENKPAPGADDFRHMSMMRIAERILQRGRINTDRMNQKDIAMVALGHTPTINRIQRAGEAYHTTGSFPNLLLDAANKTLNAGYEEADYTWSMWARQAPSVADFKEINRIRFSESPDLEHVPENSDYPEGSESDEREKYSIEKFGRVFSVTWETVVNDDLDAISRIPAMHGAAARRTQNKKVYEVLTDNDDLNDGVALFHSSHSNLAGSTGAPSITTLNAAYVSMMTQTGLTDAIINVVPRFIIVPVALSATVLQLLGSMADPSAGGTAAGNSNTKNIYGPGGGRALTPIVEPQLDGNSATAWYLAAANNQVDTVELAFLQGEESPVIESEWDFNKDVWKHKVRQTFGTKAIDYRGVYKNAG